jgi:uncharacterized protein
MQCPMDGTTLEIAERSGVEIDYCPQCRGVWLDRGELDKIIDRAAPEVRSDDVRGRRMDDDDHRSGGYHKKKRGGFLGELFDF